MLSRNNLYPYQERLAEFIRKTPRAACFVDMGLGKSVSTLTAYHDLRQSFDARRLLVVAPLRVADLVWKQEVDNWEHVSHYSVSKILGTAEQRWKALNTPTDIHVINREQTEWLEAQFISGKKQFRKWPWDMVALDESQSYKSPSSFRTKSAMRLSTLWDRVVLLSGTCMPNGYGDLWSQFKLLDDGKRLGSTYKAFEDRWFHVDPLAHTSTLRQGADVEITTAIADLTIALRAEDHLIGLPEVVHNHIRVNLTGTAMKAYRNFKRTFVTELRGQTITAANSAVLMGKLLQCANGAVYFDENQNWVTFHDEKLRALIETLESLPRKVIISYGFRHDLSRISDALQKFCGTARSWSMLDNQQDLDRWNAGQTDYLLLHPASAGHGLNLQHSGSENIVWFGLTPNLEFYQQLNARLIGGHRRAGKNVIIHHILCNNTIDDDMINLLADKDASQRGMIKVIAQQREM